jgi:hypothetical protein
MKYLLCLALVLNFSARLFANDIGRCNEVVKVFVDNTALNLTDKLSNEDQLRALEVWSRHLPGFNFETFKIKNITKLNQIDFEKNVIPNYRILLGMGLTLEEISKVFMRYSEVSTKNGDEFYQTIEWLKSNEFNLFDLKTAIRTILTREDKLTPFVFLDLEKELIPQYDLLENGYGFSSFEIKVNQLLLQTTLKELQQMKKLFDSIAEKSGDTFFRIRNITLEQKTRIAVRFESQYFLKFLFARGVTQKLYKSVDEMGQQDFTNLKNYMRFTRDVDLQWQTFVYNLKK